VCKRYFIFDAGRNVFMGYYKNEKETRDTIDTKGFVHSGDVGVLNPQGVLTITGRIKELIITAGGENVAPVLIENEVNTAIPLFNQVVVVGDKRKYLGCLLVLKTKSPGVLADEVVSYIKPKGSNATTVADAVKCPALRKIVSEGMEVANKKAISNAQRVQRFTFLLN
jgi:long-chain-fatty-acid--CoA ligase ACSBG